VCPKLGVRLTTAIVSAGGAATEAAGLCDAYENDGFTDWYLPAANELELLFKNIKSDNPGFCWSSTSEKPGSAIGIDFKNGKSTASNKLRNAKVRAIRAF
jgi:hypothetical protein